jgi:hypothetical protein
VVAGRSATVPRKHHRSGRRTSKQCRRHREQCTGYSCKRRSRTVFFPWQIFKLVSALLIIPYTFMTFVFGEGFRGLTSRNGIFSMLRRRGFPLCETSLLCSRLIQCAGYGSFGAALSDLLMNGAKRSIGTGRMVVLLCSLEISFIVCKKRSCRAIGWAEIIDAACTSFSAA